MSRRQLLRAIDTARLQQAIMDAERKTSGEVAVSVSPLFWGSVEKAAHRAFVRLGMSRTRERNGVLIFVVPARRRFMVLGDSGIHAKAGQDFWTKVASRLSEHFRAGEFTEGLVAAIDEIGGQLASHFPYDAATDRNELPNDIDFGKSG